MKKIKNIYLIGIGGAGMSGIAEILLNSGYKVSGSDNASSLITSRLQNLGINVYDKHDSENLKNIDLIVYSSAISEDNPEMIHGKKMGIPIIRRAEMLANLMNLKKSIAIAGSHGKTTTTCILAHIFTKCNLDPTYIIGGKIKSFESNAALGKGPHILAEADESDGSFLSLRPNNLIITSIDNDHLETYDGNFKKLKEAFKEFAMNVPFQGKIVFYGDSKELVKLIKKVPRNFISYGFKKTNDFQITDLTQSIEGCKFCLKNNLDNSNLKFSVPLHGEHNVLNVVASIIMSIEEGIKIKDISEALLSCKTVERRFEVISNNIFNKGITLIDDYGHHPKEISVTLETVDKIWKNNKKIVIFQPHRYSRTKALFEEFVEILSKIDDLILLDVYPASEKILKGYESIDLYKAANKRNNIIKAEGVEDALKKLKELVSDHSLILTQGAGNTSTLAKLISEYQ